MADADGGRELGRIVSVVKDITDAGTLEEELWKLPLRSTKSLSLIDLTKRLHVPLEMKKLNKEAVVNAILLHHWQKEVLEHHDRELVAAKLEKLPLKGTVSLKTLAQTHGIVNIARASKDTLIQKLIAKPEGTRQGDVACEEIKHWMVDLHGSELWQRLNGCDVRALENTVSELTASKISSLKKKRLVEELFRHAEDLKRGLPWVEKWIAEVVGAVEMFQRVHGGDMPKRVHRRRGPTTDEDKLAQRWRKLVNRKKDSELSATEVEYVEAVLGKNAWDAQQCVEDYLPGQPVFACVGSESL